MANKEKNEFIFGVGYQPVWFKRMQEQGHIEVLGKKGDLSARISRTVSAYGSTYHVFEGTKLYHADGKVYEIGRDFADSEEDEAVEEKNMPAERSFVFGKDSWPEWFEDIVANHWASVCEEVGETGERHLRIYFSAPSISDTNDDYEYNIYARAGDTIYADENGYVCKIVRGGGAIPLPPATPDLTLNDLTYQPGSEPAQAPVEPAEESPKEVTTADVYKAAIETYGMQAQLLKALEELTELQLAIHRSMQHDASSLEVITEIADVQIMTEQLSMMFGADLVTHEKQFKVTRLANRLSLIK